MRCLVPVEEHPDAGLTDAGTSDAGTSDAGSRDAGRECTRPADCTGSLDVVGWCGTFFGGSADGGFSCVEGKCVVQCAEVAGQTCTQDRGVECLRCPPTASCGCGLPLSLTSTTGEVLLGELYLQSARGLSARIDLLGGTCLATDLPTGAPRLLLDCPVCQVGLGP